MFTRIVMTAAVSLLIANGAVLAQGGRGPSDRRVTASMTSAKEVPPNPGPGTGTLEGVVNMATRELRWNVKCGGLSGPVTGMHFHGPASEAQTAGVLVPIQGGCDAAGTTGTVVVDQGGLADLLAGKWYLNVHTAAFPNGEIRGQVAVTQ